jgi:hypothetical protein
MWGLGTKWQHPLQMLPHRNLYIFHTALKRRLRSKWLWCCDCLHRDSVRYLPHFEERMSVSYMSSRRLFNELVHSRNLWMVLRNENSTAQQKDSESLQHRQLGTNGYCLASSFIWKWRIKIWTLSRSNATSTAAAPRSNTDAIMGPWQTCLHTVPEAAMQFGMLCMLPLVQNSQQGFQISSYVTHVLFLITKLRNNNLLFK